MTCGSSFGCYYRAILSTHVVGFVLVALERVDCYGCNSGKPTPWVHYGSTIQQCCGVFVAYSFSGLGES